MRRRQRWQWVTRNGRLELTGSHRLAALCEDAWADNVPATPDVVIAGDRSVRYEEVLKVLDLLQQNQVKRVGLLARPAQ